MENINITLENPNISNVDSVLTGPQGPKGDPGEPGRDGVSPTINIGETNTLSAGVPASVTNTGSDTNLILNFGIPQGPQGEQGLPGVNGTDGSDGITPTITIGTTYTLDPDQSASVTNTGTDTDLILNFGIPQGKQGDNVGCLSNPTIVEELPETADPDTFYFVPKTYTDTTVTGNNLTLTIGYNAGRIKTLSINGYLNASLEPLTGDVDITVNSDTTTVPLDTTWLAQVNTTYDEIVNDGLNWKLYRRIGYIASYDGETIDTDYVSTSGTLTPGDEVYYVLDEEEVIDIENDSITDPLNAIRTYTYETGNTTITTSANVTADLEIKYYTYDINNQYDKYVYMIDTASWELVGKNPVDTENITDNAITTSKIANNAVTSSKIDWSTVEYSTSVEQVVGKWIDGKTIYRLVVDCGKAPSNATKQVSTGLSNVRYLNLYGSAYDSVNNFMMPLNTVRRTGVGNGIGAYLSQDKICIETGVDRSTMDVYAIIEYTKNNT